jgi:hypothetical protein
MVSPTWSAPKGGRLVWALRCNLGNLDWDHVFFEGAVRALGHDSNNNEYCREHSADPSPGGTSAHRRRKSIVILSDTFRRIRPFDQAHGVVS